MGPASRGNDIGDDFRFFAGVSIHARRPQITLHDLAISDPQNLPRTPDPRAVPGSGRRRRAAVRGRFARPARTADAARSRARRDPHQARLSGAGRQAARRSHRADDLARLVAEIRRPLHPADPDRRPGVVPDRGFSGARQIARLCAFRCGAPEGWHGLRRAARAWPSRHDHRSGPGHEPLPGAGGARRRQPGRRRARIFSALGTDPDKGAARGRRGMARRRGPKTSLARRRHAAAISAQGAGARAAPISIPATRPKARSPTRWRKTTPGSKASR